MTETPNHRDGQDQPYEPEIEASVPPEVEGKGSDPAEPDSRPQTSCAQCTSDFKPGEEVFEDEEGNLFCSEDCQESFEYGS